MGNGTTQSIDIIRRPVANEDVTNAGVLNERYYAEASLRILLSDNPADITGLPCIDAAVQPFDLSDMAARCDNQRRILPAMLPSPALVAAMAANGTPLVPLAASGGGAVYNAANGYWLPANYPIIKGFIKIERQPFQGGGGCGTWKDVTREVLALGYAGRNIYAPGAVIAPPALAGLPGAEYVEAAPCPEPHPNAIIRLERIRDNPSNYLAQGGCGVAGAIVPTLPTDYWPNAIFDTREGWSRLTTPTGGLANSVTLGGTMNYVELDIKNLARWFAGTIGATGTTTMDPNIAPNNFVVYFSDRRGNYAPAGAVPGAWPQLSPSNRETGEYGFSDFANPQDVNGCPNGVLDPSEDVDTPAVSRCLLMGRIRRLFMDAGAIAAATQR